MYRKTCSRIAEDIMFCSTFAKCTKKGLNAYGQDSSPSKTVETMAEATVSASHFLLKGVTALVFYTELHKN